MAFPILPLLVAGGWVANYLGQRKQAKENAALAATQASANEAYLKQQQEYNSPASQMLRYSQAGLNPNLVYGQGNPGNQSAPLTHPDIGRTDYQSAAAALAPQLMQSIMTSSQVQAIDAKTRQTGVLTQLNLLQQRVLERNPLLDAGAYNAIIDSLKSSAELKASESTMKGIEANFMNTQDFKSGLKMGEQRLFQELDLLEQRFKLGSLDQSIKAQVLQSKDFQNAILEVQKKWMTDAEITPQHILQFIQLLLMKIL